MNIFVLDVNPKLAAQYHCDKHVVKMVLEQTQIMCTVLNDLGISTPYSSTHRNHPCVKWGRESLSNYLWLRELTLELHKEFQYRYGKTHKSGLVAESLPIPNIKDFGLLPFAQAMPEEYKDKNFVTAYRNYYKFGKTDLLKYTKRNIPNWLNK
jgi:hypothetical protein